MHTIRTQVFPTLRSCLTGNIVFVLMQVLVVSAALAATAWRVRELDRRLVLPSPRPTPLHVGPQYDEPAVVTDDQLQSVLKKLRPRLRGNEPKINHVDHALRFWGIEAEFDDPNCLSGKEMRDLLLDHRKFAEVWKKKTRPLLFHDSRGVAVRMQQGAATASHVDHTLAGLAEIGTPLDQPVRTFARDATVGEMLSHSLQSFGLNQPEYEWSVLAYALYLPTSGHWHAHDGQEITFDRLARRIMREPLSRGVCAGNHRLHTLTMLLRVDEQQSILSDMARGEVIAHLQDATRRLIEHQHLQGYWDRQWPEKPAADGPSDEQGNDPLANRILATGHALEWWALAPRDVHPPREVVVRAGQWLVRTIDELDEKKVKDYYTFLTHAGRALALWRGDFPAALLSEESAETPSTASAQAETE